VIKPKMPKQPNRFVVEVRGGVILFLNRTTEVNDGWWWGSDADPLQHGPFKTSDAALADASRDIGRFKLVRWNMAALKRDDPELRPTGHVVVVDTAGRLLVKTGEPSAAEFRATFQEMVDSGEIVPSGEMRPDRSGKLQPVYVLRRFATKH
jgi:hypothetical protein